MTQNVKRSTIRRRVPRICAQRVSTARRTPFMGVRRHVLLPIDGCLGALQASLPWHVKRDADAFNDETSRASVKATMATRRCGRGSSDLPSGSACSLASVAFGASLHVDIACHPWRSEGWTTARRARVGQVERSHLGRSGSTKSPAEQRSRTINDGDSVRLRPVANGPCRRHGSRHLRRRLKTASGLTPCDNICKIWTAKPDRCVLNRVHQMPGRDGYLLSWA